MQNEDGTMLHHRNDSTSIEDMIAYRHWHAASEKYAGGDSLATYIYLGWELGKVVQLEERWYAGTRRVAVYHFELTLKDETINMPVIANPYVDQIIARSALMMVAIGEYQRPQKEIDMEARL
jgi:hypothetical protein